MINSGDLKHRVTIQKRTMTSNGFGGWVETWTDICTVWGNYNPLSGRELLAQQQVNAQITVDVQIRYREDILPLAVPIRRIVYKGINHNVLGCIDVDNAHVELRLQCEVVHSDQ